MPGLRPWVWAVLVGGGLGLVIFAVGFWWLSRERDSASPSPRPQALLQPLDPQQVALGQTVYAANCARCHGLRAEGQPNWHKPNPDDTYPPPPHDATGHTWHHADGLLFRIVGDGGMSYEGLGFKSAMPAFKEHLSPAEIRAVLTYLKSLWGPRERTFQAEVSLQDPFP